MELEDADEVHPESDAEEVEFGDYVGVEDFVAEFVEGSSSELEEQVEYEHEVYQIVKSNITDIWIIIRLPRNFRWNKKNRLNSQQNNQSIPSNPPRIARSYNKSRRLLLRIKARVLLLTNRMLPFKDHFLPLLLNIRYLLCPL